MGFLSSICRKTSFSTSLVFIQTALMLPATMSYLVINRQLLMEGLLLKRTYAICISMLSAPVIFRPRSTNSIRNAFNQDVLIWSEICQTSWNMHILSRAVVIDKVIRLASSFFVLPSWWASLILSAYAHYCDSPRNIS